MLGYLSADIICSEKRTVLRERSLRKTVSFEKQVMSKDKYPSIFSQPNWGYCVYYPSVLKIGEYPRIFPSFSWGIIAHVTCLDQSRTRENIWWIINRYIEDRDIGVLSHTFYCNFCRDIAYLSLYGGYRYIEDRCIGVPLYVNLKVLLIF